MNLHQGSICLWYGSSDLRILASPGQFRWQAPSRYLSIGLESSAALQDNMTDKRDRI
jgi:hypothetical protein